MISIRTMTNELDRKEEELRIITETYNLGVHAAAEYAVEVNPGAADEFRAHLQALRRQINRADSIETWKSIRASFRGELREYQTKAAGELERMRAEIRASSEAIQQFSENVTASDSDHEMQIKKTLVRLDAVSRSTDLERVRTGIRSVADSISESISTMQHRHQAAIAQLRDEIRVLHKQVDLERRAHLVNQSTGVWNREEMDSRAAEFMASDRAFCLLLVYIRNLKQLDARYSHESVEKCLWALTKRLGAMLGEEAVIGRWDDNCFAAILEIPASAAMALSRAVTQKLSGAYSVQENGVAQSVSIVAVAGVIDWVSGVNDAAYQKKLKQMSEALAGA